MRGFVVDERAFGEERFTYFLFRKGPFSFVLVGRRGLYWGD